MVSCYICNRAFLSVSKLLKHMKDIHPAIIMYKCAVENCGRTYSNKENFRKHIVSIHETTEVSENLPSTSNSCGEKSTVENSFNFNLNSDIINMKELSKSNELTSKMPNSSNSNENKFKFNFVENLRKQLIDFIISLYSHPSVPRNHIQSIIKNFIHFSSSLIESVKKELELILANSNLELKICNEIEKFFSSSEVLFSKYDTEYKRLKHFEQNSLLIKPIPYKVGQYIGLKKVGRKRVPAPIDLVGQHIPLIKIFETFFNKEGVVKTISCYQNKLIEDKSCISNIIQGEFWKKTFASDNKLVIPFFVYNDDYEAGNPLSSHSGIHKISATYVSLPTLTPEFRSKLENIFMTLLFHATDRKKFGTWRTFGILIEEINQIHKSGISVETDFFTGIVYPVLILLIGDNLGLHSICGFAESFVCTYPCHICKMPLKVLRTACREDLSLLRDKENYDADVKLKNVTASGIKEPCEWNKISGWHCTQNVSFDIMHDLLKGVISYDLTLILQHFVSSKIFSLKFSNDRLENYDFGPIDNNNRPLAIYPDELTSNSLKMSAAEALAFVTHLGVIIGDKVPVDDEYWQLCLYLRRVMDVIFAPSLSQASIESLNDLVEYHNSLYLYLSPDNQLKNKFHHMVHYQRFIKLFGPLIHLWVMRHEGKHKPSKTAAASILSRRNITYSLTLRNQLQMMSALNSDFEKPAIDTSPKGEWISVGDSPVFQEISLPENFPNEVFFTDWVKNHGTSYSEGSVFVSEIRDNEPIFFIIHSIFVSEASSIYFLCYALNEVVFDEHRHAYKVQPADYFSLVNFDDIKVHILCSLSQAPNGDYYIPLRHKW